MSQGVVEITDLTTVLSTTIQATATIVAIIGGVLVSKLIGVGAERQSIHLHLSELRKELASAETHIRSLDDRVRQATLHAVEAALGWMVNTGGTGTFEQFLDKMLC